MKTSSGSLPSSLTIEDKAEFKRALKAELAKRGYAVPEPPPLRLPLRTFIREAWHELHPATAPLVPGWHLDALSDHLEAVSRGEIRRLLINVPPGTSKSLTVAVFWPVWEWTTAPHLQYLSGSYGLNLAIRDTRRARILIQSEWYQERWGSVYQMTGDQNAKLHYENDRRGWRLAVGIDGDVTGRRADRLILDDPHKAGEARSPTKREGVIDFYETTWQNRHNNDQTAEVVIMQRLHTRDLSGYLLSEVGDFEHLCLPMRYDPARTCVTVLGRVDPRTEAGELLCEKRFDEDAVSRQETILGSYGTAGQLQQRPAPEGGGILQKKWFRYYEMPPKRFDEVIQSWDMSFKKTEDGSFVVGQVWGRLGANKYLLDRVRGRWSFTETLVQVEILSEDWPKARLKLVEEAANGAAVIDTLHGRIVGLVPVRADTSKEARMYAVAPDIEAGNVYLPHPEDAPWVRDFVESASLFPFGEHDDDEDAMSQALIRFRAPPNKLSLADVLAGDKEGISILETEF